MAALAPETAPPTLPASVEACRGACSTSSADRTGHCSHSPATSPSAVIDRDDVHVHQIATNGTALENGVPTATDTPAQHTTRRAMS